jgi:hypothetical protein
VPPDPRVNIIIRGDNHYRRPEAMPWCERYRVAHIFGLAGDRALLRRVSREAEKPNKRSSIASKRPPEPRPHSQNSGSSSKAIDDQAGFRRWRR